jgi:hypothetical protein
MGLEHHRLERVHPGIIAFFKAPIRDAMRELERQYALAQDEIFATGTTAIRLHPRVTAERSTETR